VLTTEFARVVVLGKHLNPNLAQFSDYYVPEKNLADRTIREFSRLSSGLLQGIALRGMAHLRQNNRRVLARFNESLDLAFLIHRALILPEEAFAAIPGLLTDELTAVLEDALGDSPLGSSSETKRIITDWCTHNWEEADEPAVKVGQKADANEFAAYILCNGPSLEGDYSKNKGSQIPELVKVKDDGVHVWKNDKTRGKLAKYLLGKRGREDFHERLGSLMCQRAMYGSSERRLHLGVVVKEVHNEKRYLLCLQPLCDSVRLGGRTQPFVFCTMAETKQGNDFTHCIVNPNGTMLRLTYKPSISNVFVSSFRSARAARPTHGRFVFSDVEERNYEWIAELKTEHAQHAAELFGNQVSRIGLVQSEWMRLKAKKA